MAASDPGKTTQRVVLTRPANRQKALANHLRQAGCEVLELSALTISPVHPTVQSSPIHVQKQDFMEDRSTTGPLTPEKCVQARAIPEEYSRDARGLEWQPEQFDALVFVSRAAWQYYCQFYLERQPSDTLANESALATSVKLGKKPILACVGLSTAQQIAADLDVEVSSIMFPSDGISSDSEGLWTILQSKLAPNAKVLIVRGQTGRDWLADALARLGVSVTCLAVYQREPATFTVEQLQTLKQWASPSDSASVELECDSCPNTGTWVITSAEGLAAIEQQYALHGLTGRTGFNPARVVVIHERLVAPVRNWLTHWQSSGDLVSGSGAKARTPVVVVSPDDQSIAAAVLTESES